MIINFDLLGIPCSEYCEHDGVKGIFIPEVPNFRYIPGGTSLRSGMPARAIIRFVLLKTRKKSQSYDFMGKMSIWPEHQDAYIANPNTVNRRPYVAYGYNFVPRKDETPAPVSDARDFERLLED